MTKNDIIPLINDFVELLSTKIKLRFSPIFREVEYMDPPSTYIISAKLFYIVEGGVGNEIYLVRNEFLNNLPYHKNELVKIRENQINNDIESEKNNLGINLYEKEVQKIIN